MSNAICTVDGCEKPSRSNSGKAMCKMHYHRWYRHGSHTVVSTGVEGVSLGRRYTTSHAPSHPLASKHGIVYNHRRVLYDAIGAGPHSCYWCGTEVEWLPKGQPGELQVDHLNNDGGDNRLENLKPSCRTCNITRGVQRRATALRELGLWSSHDTVAALADGRKPLIEPAA